MSCELAQPARLPERARDLLPGDTPAVDLLLDQRVAAGTGSTYKSVGAVHRPLFATVAAC